MPQKSREELLAIYSTVGEFSEEGLAPAREKNTTNKKGMCLYINTDGSPAFSRKFVTAGNFHNGVAIVQEEDRLFVYILPNGNNASNERYQMAGEFSEGRARVRQKNAEFHIRLTDFSPTYPQRYPWVSPFLNGKAKVGDSDGTTFEIDLSGKRLS